MQASTRITVSLPEGDGLNAGRVGVFAAIPVKSNAFQNVARSSVMVRVCTRSLPPGVATSVSGKMLRFGSVSVALPNVLDVVTEILEAMRRMFAPLRAERVASLNVGVAGRLVPSQRLSATVACVEL